MHNDLRSQKVSICEYLKQELVSLELEKPRPNTSFKSDLVAFLVEVFDATTADKYKFVYNHQTLERFPFKYNFKVSLVTNHQQDSHTASPALNTSQFSDSSVQYSPKEDSEAE